MNIYYSLIFMFVGSFIIGIYFNAMNFLANQYKDIYFYSNTLIYSALLMASNMCILEIFMYYGYHYELHYKLLIFFIVLSLLLIIVLRLQIGVNDNNWLKRMISHHSTALTTSKKIVSKTKNKEVKDLAKSIIEEQEKEIKIMEKILSEKSQS